MATRTLRHAETCAVVYEAMGVGGGGLKMLAPRLEQAKQEHRDNHNVKKLHTIQRGSSYFNTVCMVIIITCSKGKDQPSKVANPTRDQLNKENEHQVFPCPRSRLRIWSGEAGSAVPYRVSLLISMLRLNLVLTYGIPPEFRGGDVHFFTSVASC